MRDCPASGEKPVIWIGSAKDDLLEFPEAVVREVGVALSVAQYGDTHSAAKPWKGEGPGVLEVVRDFDRATYRAVYTVRFTAAIYVLHCFQKKSPKSYPFHYRLELGDLPSQLGSHLVTTRRLLELCEL